MIIELLAVLVPLSVCFWLGKGYVAQVGKGVRKPIYGHLKPDFNIICANCARPMSFMSSWPVKGTLVCGQECYDTVLRDYDAMVVSRCKLMIKVQVEN